MTKLDEAWRAFEHRSCAPGSIPSGPEYFIAGAKWMAEQVKLSIEAHGPINLVGLDEQLVDAMKLIDEVLGE